jgi:hypothetical protein
MALTSDSLRTLPNGSWVPNSVKPEAAETDADLLAIFKQMGLKV